MPSWKKIIVSGSDASLNSITASNGLFGTASWALNVQTSSYPFTITGSTIYASALSIATVGSKDRSLFIGTDAGSTATDADDSVFIGASAGQNATNAAHSIHIGNSAGLNAAQARHSRLLGNGAGRNAENAEYSTLIGFNVGAASATANSIGSNNVIIGTNITLPVGTQNTLNMGGIIYATGMYATTAGNPSSGSQYGSGKVGINTLTPGYTLDVSGSANITDGLVVTGSAILKSLVTSSIALTDVLMISSSGQIFTTSSSAIGGGGATLKAGSASLASFAGTPFTSSITFGSAFSTNLYAVTVTGEDARSWTIQSKSSAGFTINSNSTVALTGPVYWIATPFN